MMDNFLAGNGSATEKRGYSLAIAVAILSIAFTI